MAHQYVIRTTAEGLPVAAGCELMNVDIDSSSITNLQRMLPVALASNIIY